MKRRTRRVLFWFAVIIFGVASYVAILYAQGYRYNLDDNHFVRTGGVAVTSNVDAGLFVDDVLVGAGSFLSHRSGTDNLLPGEHSVRLVKDGFSAWRKSAQVQEGQLVDFPSVLLLPTDEDSLAGLREEIMKTLTTAHQLKDAIPTPSPKPTKVPPKEIADGDFVLRGEELWLMNTASGSLIAEHVLGFQPIDDHKQVMWFTRNEVWVQWFKNTNYQPYRTDGDKELVTRFSTPIVRAAWFRDADHVVVDLGGSYRVLETDLRGGINIIRI